MPKSVHCIMLDKDAEGLDFAPYPGELGQRIFAQVSKKAWQQWLALQTMLINEQHLSPVNPEHRKYLEEQMENHFFGGGSDKPAGYVPPDES